MDSGLEKYPQLDCCHPEKLPDILLLNHSTLPPLNIYLLSIEMYLNTDIFDVIDSLWYGVTLGGWRIAGLTVPTLKLGRMKEEDI